MSNVKVADLSPTCLRPVQCKPVISSSLAQGSNPLADFSTVPLYILCYILLCNCILGTLDYRKTSIGLLFLLESFHQIQVVCENSFSPLNSFVLWNPQDKAIISIEYTALKPDVRRFTEVHLVGEERIFWTFCGYSGNRSVRALLGWWRKSWKLGTNFTESFTICRKAKFRTYGLKCYFILASKSFPRT